LTVILQKLDQVLEALGGQSQSNPTLRWDQALPAAQRFVTLAAFNNEAVLDKETGLVWEKSPSTAGETWNSARSTCANKAVGGRKGWRLGSMAELSSLVDPTQSNPALPTGHPFNNVQASNYWSAASFADNPSFAWLVFFFNGGVNAAFKASSFHVWCVRGGMSESQY
jgi:hypothetical protein